MTTKIRRSKISKHEDAVVTFPMSAVRTISRSARGRARTVVIEILAKDLKRMSAAAALDRMIDVARRDYVKGHYATATSAEELIKALNA